MTEAVRDFYDATLADQRAWSRELNLHFGYYRSGRNPLDREGLLDETNAQVTRRLGLSALSDGLVLDAGAGAGATARHVASGTTSGRTSALMVGARLRDRSTWRRHRSTYERAR